MDKIESIENIEIDGRKLAIAPEGYKVHDLSENLESPTRISRRVDLGCVASVMDYATRFYNKEASIYSDDQARKIEVVFDHSSPDTPQWHEHTASYKAKNSIEYDAWLRLCSKRSSLTELAKFLEDRRGDVVEPSGAEMLALALNFKATRNASFSNQNNLRNGSVQFTYAEDNKASGTIEVPETIKLNIPLFDRDEPQEVTVRVSWRLDQGAVDFAFEVVNQKEMERARFDEIVDLVASETTISNTYKLA